MYPRIKSINPYTLEIIKDYEQTSDQDVHSALVNSQKAFQDWGFISLDERLRCFEQLKKIIIEEKKMLSELATLEMGKPIAQSHLEVEKCALTCEHYLQSANEILKPKVVKTESSQSFVCYQPLGVILGIMPWNFPYWQVLRFAIPTMIAGNCILLKHASNVSGCALALESLFKKAGFPEGVFKTLLMSSDRIENVISNSIIQGVSLTGSTEAGRQVAKSAGQYLKKLVLELGGSDPYLILEDADLKLSSEQSMKSRLQNNGQSCVAAKRFIVSDHVYDSFKKQILDLANQVQLGDPMNLKTTLGPVARKDLKLELHDQVQNAVRCGAQIFYQGKLNLDDAFYPVTILENVDENNPAYVQEFFGPVIMLFKFKTLQQALEIANHTPFGLGSAVFTKDIDFALKNIIPKLNAGNCFINQMVRSDPRLPFGGVKDSGYGRELSSNGMLEFTNIKTVSVS